MKNYLFFLILSVGFTACSKLSHPIQKPSVELEDHNQSVQSKNLVIDVDEELLLQEEQNKLRDEESRVLDAPIYIGDNDEVSFKGESIEKKSPLSIQYGRHDAISFSGKNFTIKSMELNSGDNIKIKDKNGNIFIDMKVIK